MYEQGKQLLQFKCEYILNIFSQRSDASPQSRSVREGQRGSHI